MKPGPRIHDSIFFISSGGDTQSAKLQRLAMAATSSICNFLSFLLPKQSPLSRKPPSQLIPTSHPSDSLPTLSSSTYTREVSSVPVPLMADDMSSPSNDFMSVVCPSLAYSNTLFFNSAYNVQVVVGEDESEEVLLRRFKREVMKSGIIQECKRRRFFENSQEEKKRRVRDAAKRNKRRRPYRPPVVEKEGSKGKNDDDDQDNWDLPDGSLPY